MPRALNNRNKFSKCEYKSVEQLNRKKQMVLELGKVTSNRQRRKRARVSGKNVMSWASHLTFPLLIFVARSFLSLSSLLSLGRCIELIENEDDLGVCYLTAFLALFLANWSPLVYQPDLLDNLSYAGNFHSNVNINPIWRIFNFAVHCFIPHWLAAVITNHPENIGKASLLSFGTQIKNSRLCCAASQDDGDNAGCVWFIKSNYVITTNVICPI